MPHCHPVGGPLTVIPDIRAASRAMFRLPILFLSVILSLALTVEARDSTTDGHCQRLARYAVSLGTELGLTEEEIAPDPDFDVVHLSLGGSREGPAEE